jgi:hypothetical protein
MGNVWSHRSVAGQVLAMALGVGVGVAAAVRLKVECMSSMLVCARVCLVRVWELSVVTER